jgi:hypothetical protein
MRNFWRDLRAWSSQTTLDSTAKNAGDRKKKRRKENARPTTTKIAKINLGRHQIRRKKKKLRKWEILQIINQIQRRR